VFNLYDLTGGDYNVLRTVTYPDFPTSHLDFDTRVKAVSGTEWSTEMNIKGNYDGPTDIVGVRDYQVAWTSEGKTLIEKGSATLLRGSGGEVRSVWKSSIVSTGKTRRALPGSGETVRVTYTPFQLKGNTMSYDWHGTVEAGKRRQEE
jgi:hypothetical protein